jgi:hypothetical protein
LQQQQQQQDNSSWWQADRQQNNNKTNGTGPLSAKEKRTMVNVLKEA